MLSLTFTLFPSSGTSSGYCDLSKPLEIVLAMMSVLSTCGCSPLVPMDLFMSSFFKCSDILDCEKVFIVPGASTGLRGVEFLGSTFTSKDRREEYTEFLCLFCVLCYHHPVRQQAHTFPSLPFAAGRLGQVLTVQHYSVPHFLLNCLNGKFPERERRCCCLLFNK